MDMNKELLDAQVEIVRKEADIRELRGENERALLHMRNLQARIRMATASLRARQEKEALAVLEEKDLRCECQSCEGPCDKEGKQCLVCGEMQPQDSQMERCPPRPMAGVAAACNEGATK
jgi:hypothetical protein